MYLESMNAPAGTQTASRAETVAWHRLTGAEALTRREATTEGLSEAEAAVRLERFGPNELQAGEGIRPWKIFLAQFHSLIIWVLIGAGTLSGVLGEVSDAIAILAIVVLNACIGFYQEWNAEKSIAALKRMTAPRAAVRRSRVTRLLPSREVVPGDILRLEAGDRVAADARLLEASSLRCLESALTGESDAVAKQCEARSESDLPLGDRDNLVFLGTTVTSGAGWAVVTGTGMDTELGRIAGLIDEAAAEGGTPLQKRLDAFGRVLVWATLGLVAALFLLGLWRGFKPFEFFMTSVSLAVAAVPEGLPAVVTVALALGVLRMARRRALVRRLPSVETLGSTTVICTDKTGTLTVGQMTVRALYAAGRRYAVTGEGYGPEGQALRGDTPVTVAGDSALGALVHVMLGCNTAQLRQENGLWLAVGDPTEAALLAGGRKAGGNPEALETEWARVGAIPFESDRKRGAVIRRGPEGRLRILVNGAPENLLERCNRVNDESGVRPMTPEDRARLLAENAALAEQGLRVLGSAWRDLEPGEWNKDSERAGGGVTAIGEAAPDALERNLVFAGLSGLQDPPRPQAKAAVAACRAAGIRVVMITGDHPRTALAIARELGIARKLGIARVGEDIAREFGGTDGAGQTDAACLTGVELDALSDSDLAARVESITVYARVTAAHKLRIVRAWKAKDAVVAMTGDGVNDAPAIKGADIGISMGLGGTEVAKQASDMILADDDFATIVAAVEEGRGIYDNIRKTLQYLLGGNTGELLVMTVCVAAGFPSPLLPIHLLWINLVTDGLPALCLATDPIDSDLMRRPPRRRGESITDGGFLFTMILTGLLTSGVSLTAFFVTLHNHSLATARGAAFSVLVFAELLRALGARSETKPIWRIPFFTNRNLIGVVGVSLLVQVFTQDNDFLERVLKTTGLPLADIALLLALGAVPLLALEALKAVGPILRRGTPPGISP